MNNPGHFPYLNIINRGVSLISPVNYYNLIIEGKNFKSNSTVVVDGKSMTASSANPFDRERVRYVDCTNIIYERHPYDSEIKSFNVQVINPNGEESAMFQVSAP